LRTELIICSGVLLFSVAVAGAGCSLGKGASLPSDDAGFSVIHPREAARRVAQYAEEIERVIGREVRLDRAVVLPVPCGGEDSQRSVPGRNTDLSSWWVSYSPYSESIDTFLELDSAHSIQSLMARLRDGLQKAGWRIVEYTEESPSESAVLKAAAPESGYGATFEGIAPTVERSPRIGVNVSSPCLRHPEAR
jgi:hypothetical protein